MKRLLAALAVLCLLAMPAHGVTPSTTTYDFSVTSPAAAGTSNGTPTGDLSLVSVCAFYASVVGATGGTLDIYIQASIDGGTTYYDMAHLPQLAAGAAAIVYSFGVNRGGIGAAPVVGGDGVLAVNTIIPGSLGRLMRMKLVAGASTSAGAVLVVKAACSSM